MRFWSILAAVLPLTAIILVRESAATLLFSLPIAPLPLVVESKGDFESMANSLNRKGFKAQAPAAIVGKSGVKHEFAFALTPDAGKAKIVVDTELSVGEVDEMKVLKFYVKVFDVGPEKAVLCVCPRLGERAATLAKEYGITVLENDVPRKLIPMAEKVVNEIAATGAN